MKEERKKLEDECDQMDNLLDAQILKLKNL